MTFLWAAGHNSTVIWSKHDHKPGGIKHGEKGQSKAKRKKQPEKLLIKVPAQYVFYCHDGSVFADRQELAEGLETMSDEAFRYHSDLEKQDFSNWVRDVIGDEQLAKDLAKASNRLQAAEYLVARIALLTSK